MPQENVPRHAVVIGAGGAIGSAFARALRNGDPNLHLQLVSRNGVAAADGRSAGHLADFDDEASLQAISGRIAADGPVDLILVATGLLHDDQLRPEKSLRDISAAGLERLYFANAVVPALALKHFAPLLRRDGRAVFAALSARVGSIGDNRLGGWYGYRAAKAGLNMIIRNAGIELTRRNPRSIVVGLHPGTVDSRLSKPFQAGVKPGNLFSADHAAGKLLDVVAGLTPDDTGHCFAWDGKRIPA
ncbi:SDR family NAD(P)-dependent oxidoreductase [Hoeflea poritis]|uniref:SDR family NAD(P)-dependent oxidoreductase n=1 Tax=Hoeflea poritis TaxID=2993659 RepID=A0ABT4VNI2_9HYPH|nr:SDR family NAD(P)-dependent oxidoreductase [Hoeflea poritis]MDA4846236.1 SDR family NAD(P)-dependent oxidoreductase [Hoeflea poritis]